MILRLAALFLTWLALSASASAQAPQRFALTIGNEDYSGALTPLNRPHEDGDRLGGALKAAGFSVRPTEDQSRSDIIREVSALAERLRAAGPEAIGFFYYSGHGASALVGGRRQNFLIPARSSISRAQELVADGVPLDTIIALLEQTGAKAVFIVFDACRTELPWSKGGADPDKAFNTVSARPGMFIAYSTAEGASAPDDGAFAAALAEQLVRPDRPHLNAFDAAARSVGRTRGTDRLPWYSNQIADDIYFVTRPQVLTPALLQSQPIQPVAPAASVAPPPSYLDARTTPATTRAPLISGDPKSLPDFALFRECEGCPEMVILPSGTFTMGSSDEKGPSNERPARQVSIKRFAISRFETTWDEWETCVAAGFCRMVKTAGSGGGDVETSGRGRRPVLLVDLGDIRKFASFLSGRTGYSHRLPSESEWEYAARSGSSDKYSWGSAAPVCDPQAVNGAVFFAACTGPQMTRPVGSFRSNAFGLFDMHGNLQEAVQDCYSRDYSAGQPTDGSAFSPSSCINPGVSRGGSYYNGDPLNLRSAARGPFVSHFSTGFRIARTL